ncbi:hypothetical protein [Paraburkholderia caribensis]
MTDADGRATVHRYDYHNQIVRVEQPDGSRDTYTWTIAAICSRVRTRLGR